MDFSPFREDIDELIQEFDNGECKTLAQWKKIWLSRKFTYIFDVKPSINLSLFMQSLYNHCISHMIEDYNLSHRLGGLYCLYCLYETQPFKPPFKVYLSLGELRRIKVLVIHAKERGIKVVVSVIRRMLENNAFLFGFVDPNEYSESDNVKKAVKAREACLKRMNDKLFTGKDLEILGADMGTILDFDAIKNYSLEYELAKALSVRGAEPKVDVQHSKNIPDKQTLFVDEVKKIIEEWDNQKAIFNQELEADCSEKYKRKKDQSQPMEAMHHPARELPSKDDAIEIGGEDQHPGSEVNQDEDLDYIRNLEEQLSES